jgi:hypothetical protein
MPQTFVVDSKGMPCNNQPFVPRVPEEVTAHMTRCALFGFVARPDALLA